MALDLCPRTIENVDRHPYLRDYVTSRYNRQAISATKRISRTGVRRLLNFDWLGESRSDRPITRQKHY